MSKRKIRVSFHKNLNVRQRKVDVTREYLHDAEATELAASSERVRAKGDLSRKRTIQLDSDDGLAVDETECLRGRVLMVKGLSCTVVTDAGASYRCYVRRLLKSLETDVRCPVTAGDWVRFRPAGHDEGLIVRVEPRQRVLSRGYRDRAQVVAANVDQVLIVGSVVEPELKPNLIDRYLVTAEKAGLRPIICINKIDRAAEPFRVQPLVGLYSQLGYSIVLTSAVTGQNVELVRRGLAGRETVVVGQSGVGKSSLLNALDPQWHLRISEVSAATHKGRHTTTTAQLLRLNDGGAVFDTPGVRQFGLWDFEPLEVEGYFVEFRPFVSHCRFPGCTHRQEAGCAVRAAVDDHRISIGRYESYLRMLSGQGSNS